MCEPRVLAILTGRRVHDQGTWYNFRLALTPSLWTRGISLRSNIAEVRSVQPPAPTGAALYFLFQHARTDFQCKFWGADDSTRESGLAERETADATAASYEGRIEEPPTLLEKLGGIPPVVCGA